jgi:hypothetical protein
LPIFGAKNRTKLDPKTLAALADGSIERARKVALGPHALTYDSINLSTSIFVEQGPNMMNKVQSGTFAVIYELLNAQLEDMQIEPIVQNLRKATPLTITEISPMIDSLRSYLHQSTINVVKILFKFVEGFRQQKITLY